VPRCTGKIQHPEISGKWIVIVNLEQISLSAEVLTTRMNSLIISTSGRQEPAWREESVGGQACRRPEEPEVDDRPAAGDRAVEEAAQRSSNRAQQEQSSNNLRRRKDQVHMTKSQLKQQNCSASVSSMVMIENFAIPFMYHSVLVLFFSFQFIKCSILHWFYPLKVKMGKITRAEWNWTTFLIIVSFKPKNLI